MFRMQCNSYLAERANFCVGNLIGRNVLSRNSRYVEHLSRFRLIKSKYRDLASHFHSRICIPTLFRFPQPRKVDFPSLHAHLTTGHMISGKSPPELPGVAARNSRSASTPSAYSEPRRRFRDIIKPS